MQKSAFPFKIIFAVFTFITVKISALPLLTKDGKYTNPFVGFYVFPHGGITLDPKYMDYSKQPGFDRPDSQESAIRIHDAMALAADHLIRSNPDVIIFSTPHSFAFTDSLLLLGKTASGSAGGIWDNFTVSIDIDKALTHVLYTELKAAKDPVEVLVLSDGFPTAPINWAEVIPWYFIREASKRAGRTNPPKAIYIGQPARINAKCLTNYGRDIVKTGLIKKEFSKKRIAVVISGDLSHYHSKDPSSPYPFDPISRLFDDYIVTWAKLDRQADKEGESKSILWSKAGMIQEQAGHCAYSGLLMLHGMMEEVVHQGWNFKSNFYAYEVPSYFGMMVMSWTPIKKA